MTYIKGNKGLSVLILLSLIVTMSLIPLNKAEAATSIIDNDATSSSPGYNQVDGDWAYVKNSSSLNGDHRMSKFTSTSKNQRNYHWIWSSLHSLTGSYYVYLNSKEAANPAVQYQMSEGYAVAVLNQAWADAGWNNIGTTTKSNYWLSVNLMGESSSLGSTVADGAKFVY